MKAENGLDKESMFWIGGMLGYIVSWIINFKLIGFVIIAVLAMLDLFVLNRGNKNE